MKERILKWVGLDKKSQYVRDFLFSANIRASVYMSVIIALLELWMIVRLLSRQLQGIDVRSGDYYVSHYFNYGLLLSVAVAMLIYAIRFIRGKKYNKVLGYVLKWSFMLICLSFGIEISAADYGRGEQVFTFLTMELFAVCLLVWEPYISFLIISISYIIFYLTIDGLIIITSSAVGTTDATKINLFIMWIATVFCSISSYQRTRTQADREESLEAANAELERLVILDELTGIHNMRYFRSEAKKLLKTSPGAGRYTFVFLNIVNFHEYNEKHGFSEGNGLLKETAKLIEIRFRGSLTARLSDDHFVVLTAGTSYKQVVESISEELKEAAEDVELSLRFGVFSPDDMDIDPMLACDKARSQCGE